jgi:hypothetical protein
MNVRLDLAAFAVGAVYLFSFFPLGVIFSASQIPTIPRTSHVQISSLSRTSSYSTPAAPVSLIQLLVPHPSSCVYHLDSLTRYSSSIGRSCEVNGALLASVSAGSRVAPSHELRCGRRTRSTCIQLHSVFSSRATNITETTNTTYLIIIIILNHFSAGKTCVGVSPQD